MLLNLSIAHSAHCPAQARGSLHLTWTSYVSASYSLQINGKITVWNIHTRDGHVKGEQDGNTT